MIRLWYGDCLEKMKDIPTGSIDLILTDPPYGTTQCKWDIVIPFDLMWLELNRIIKDNGAICLFGSEPFSSHLRLSNLKMFKYDWVWYKNTVTGIAQAKYMPMKAHEIISVFYSQTPNFYPIKTRTRSEHIFNCAKKGLKRGTTSKTEHNELGGVYGGDFQTHVNPRTVLEFNGVNNRDKNKRHPTQKPIDLLEYLIKTYTLKNETVLDFTMGSGSTGVACKNLNRKFIGIEKDETYFKIAENRIYL